ncbi:MAG: hypothetical protein V1790_17735 [Planctomycetota bacterium]
MTPERLAEVREALHNHTRAFTPDELARKPLFGIAEELVLALETEQTRLDCLAKLRPGELFDALSNPLGLRAALDRLIAARERGKGET